MNRIAVCCACVIVVAGFFAFAVTPSGATGVEGRSYSYTTLEDDPETGCGKFAEGGAFYVDVDGYGYEGTWRQRRFRGMSFFKAHVEYMGIHYYTSGAMPRQGFIVGSAVQLIDGGWKVKYVAEDTGCTPVGAP
jgi:hypothetical protein